MPPLAPVKDSDMPVVGSRGSETDIGGLRIVGRCGPISVETLRDLNYRVREAPDGAAALALFDP